MWRLAWRNLWRHRVRTLITASAIALSVGLQLFGYGIADSTYEKMRASAERAAGGAVLVHADGYWSSLAADRILTQGSPVVAALRDVDGVASVVPRVIVAGLLSSARDSTGIRLLGVERDRELAMDDVSRFLVAGTFLEEPKARRAPLVLGKSVAEDLGLDLGDRAVLTATDPSGETTRIAMRLTGLVDTGSKMTDAVAAWTSIDALRRALRVPDAVTQLGLILDPGRDAGAVADASRAALSAGPEPAEVLTWNQAMPELQTFIDMDKQWGNIFGLLIFVVVAFGITNTFMMAVLERVRELGLLAALGLSPGRVARLLLAESVILGVLSVLTGIGLALIGHVLVARHGIDYAAFVGGDVEISGIILEDLVIYSHVDPVRWGLACASVLVLIVLAASYPAWKATRMEPAAAMRAFE